MLLFKFQINLNYCFYIYIILIINILYKKYLTTICNLFLSTDFFAKISDSYLSNKFLYFFSLIRNLLFMKYLSSETSYFCNQSFGIHVHICNQHNVLFYNNFRIKFSLFCIVSFLYRFSISIFLIEIFYSL